MCSPLLQNRFVWYELRLRWKMEMINWNNTSDWIKVTAKTASNSSASQSLVCISAVLQFEWWLVDCAIINAAHNCAIIMCAAIEASFQRTAHQFQSISDLCFYLFTFYGWIKWIFCFITGIKHPICAVSGAQYLSAAGWTELRNAADLDIPFRLFRDEGRTFLQVIIIITF